MNPMKEIRIEKVTVNMGTGTNQDLLKKGMKLIEKFTGIPPVKTKSNKRIPSWNVRPGLPVGCKITLRGENAQDILTRSLKSKENILKDTCFDTSGNVSFGIKEYIDIPGLPYEPEIGIIGFQVVTTLERRGYRVKKRKVCPSKIGHKHLVTKEDAIKFFNEKFGVKVEG